jgi:hypothetical protein
MADVLFINGDYIKRFTQLHGSVEDAYFYSHISLAQDKYTQIYLGTNLYEKLKSDISGGTLTGDYLTLVDDHVRKVTLWWMMVEAIPSFHVRMDNGGLVVRVSEDTQPITKGDLNREMDRARNNAQFYTERMIDYLCDNTNLFPEYNNNTGDQIRPTRDAIYEAGMGFQGSTSVSDVRFSGGGAGGGSTPTTYKTGFIDYNDTTGDLSVAADTWVNVPNNGEGAFTNTQYKPTGINNVLDVDTGFLDFSELSLGSQILVRNDFTITPNTNNALLEVRYLLGTGEGQYALQFWSERLDNGSGIGYQRVISFPIYMGDTNTRDNEGILQVKLSTTGTLNNSGSYIKIDLR